MPKHVAKTSVEALKLVALMQNHGAWAEIGLDHRTVTYANLKAWKRVKSQLAQMEEVRKVSERYNDRIKQEELI